MRTPPPARGRDTLAAQWRDARARWREAPARDKGFAIGVFGVWHIRPTIQALAANGLAGERGQAVARVAAGVAATTAGGVLFSWLRARSGSLAAPVLLHAATNSGGLAAAALARRLNAHCPSRPSPAAAKLPASADAGSGG